MANIEVSVRTPAVPSTLTLDLPGSSRGARLDLSEFTETDLKKVGEAWTAALLEERLNQLRDDGTE